jgi:hypothetical protein
MGKATKLKRGRPPKPADQRRSGQARPLFIPLTPAERADLDAKAAAVGEPLSAWARRLLLRAARR